MIRFCCLQSRRESSRYAETQNFQVIADLSYRLYNVISSIYTLRSCPKDILMPLEAVHCLYWKDKNLLSESDPEARRYDISLT